MSISFRYLLLTLYVDEEMWVSVTVVSSEAEMDPFAPPELRGALSAVTWWWWWFTL